MFGFYGFFFFFFLNMNNHNCIVSLKVTASEVQCPRHFPCPGRQVGSRAVAAAASHFRADWNYGVSGGSRALFRLVFLWILTLYHVEYLSPVRTATRLPSTLDNPIGICDRLNPEAPAPAAAEMDDFINLGSVLWNRFSTNIKATFENTSPKKFIQLTILVGACECRLISSLLQRC
jgi:hypothetical protein